MGDMKNEEREDETTNRGVKVKDGGDGEIVLELRNVHREHDGVDKISIR